MDTTKIKQVVEIFEKSTVSTMDLETKDLKIKLEKKDGEVVSSMPQTEPVSSPIQTVRSFLVGTFDAASSPDQPPFVQVGQHINKGDTLCIIEAMKVMNEMKAPQSGTIQKVLVTDGDMVEYDQPLFELGDGYDSKNIDCESR